jgi:hypothetical protein
VAGSGAKVPCSSSWGVWSYTYKCYLRPDPKPPANLAPGSKTGAWYLCHLPDSPVDTNEFPVWIDGPTPVDPAELARQLLAQIQLARIDIGITPSPGHTGFVGLPTYLWVNNPGARTLGPISDSTSAGGVTVTISAKVSRVEWSLGDGTTITCTGAGTPYRTEFRARPSPTCGHVYQHPSTSLPDGAYQVTAKAVWDVSWTGGGQAGTIPFEVTSETSIRMSEAQALN